MPDLSQSVVWVAVPNGVVDGKPQLSVVVYPRLFVRDGGQPSTTILDNYADFRVWPGQSEGTQFDIQFSSGTSAPTSARASRVSRKPDMPLWQTLFPRETLVRSYQAPDPWPLTTIAYPASSLEAYLQGRYRAVAQGSPWTLPTAERLMAAFNQIVPAVLREGQDSTLLYQVVTALAATGYVADYQAPPDPARDWLLARLYARPARHDLRPGRAAFPR